ncbi:MAG TPA: DUF3376 domain-containing protein, partial [Acidimicrobiales bacterium]|nr:DUF3376 domain-containing protein [Acidimicrobiales bacterium]
DNIPIARALDAATRAPASGPTERKLVYLQPGSRGSQEEPRPGAPRTSTAAVFKGALAARMSGENINADIEAIELHNEAVRRANALRLGGFDGITDRAALLVAARSRWGAYVSTRSGADAARAMALLRDPVGVLGADPFPRAIGVEPVHDDRWRSPLGPWGSSEREELGAGLHYLFHGALSAITPPASRDALVATHDPEALHRVALLLLEWARYLEARDVPVGSTKQSLYGLRAFIEEALLGASRQLWVAAAAQLGTPTAAAYVARMIEVLPDLFRVDLAPAAMAKALLEDDAGVLRGEVREVYLRIDQVLTGTAPLGTTDLLVVLTDVLVRLGEALATTPVPGPTTDPALQAGAALDAALRGIGPIDAHALAALDVVCLPEFVAGLPGRRRIEFHRCSSENRTPVARWFSAIREEIPVADAETAPTGLRTHLVPVARKLAGNELGNFSAFLLPEWRANDWLWGRLDAAVTLGDLLVRPEPLARWLATQGTTVDDWHDALRARVRGADEPWDNAVVDAIWDEEDIRAELATLLAAGAEVADVELPAIRDTFVARRQWDILCAERIGEPWSEPDAGAFDATNEWVGDYAVGDQTLASSNDRSGLRSRLADIVVAVTRTAVWNLKLGTAEDKAPRFVTGLLWGIGPRAGKIAGKRLTAPEQPPGKGRGRTALLALLVLLVWVGVPVALAALLGWDVAGPVLLGIVLLPLVVLAGFALWVRGVARRVDRHLSREDG